MPTSTAGVRAWRAANPDRARASQRRYRRKNTKRIQRYAKAWAQRHRVGVRAALLKKQGGRCAICRTKKSRPWHKDHCHRHGHVRGVLCTNCNWGLGHFKDNPALLRTAAQYLERAP